MDRKLPVPAVNRWVQVFPVVAFFAFFLSVQGIYLRAFMKATGTETEDAAEEPASEGEALGAPSNETEAFRKLKAKRKKKALCWLTGRPDPWL